MRNFCELKEGICAQSRPSRLIVIDAIVKRALQFARLEVEYLELREARLNFARHEIKKYRYDGFLKMRSILTPSLRAVVDVRLRCLCTRAAAPAFDGGR